MSCTVQFIFADASLNHDRPERNDPDQHAPIAVGPDEAANASLALAKAHDALRGAGQG